MSGLSGLLRRRSRSSTDPSIWVRDGDEEDYVIDLFGPNLYKILGAAWFTTFVLVYLPLAALKLASPL